MRRWMVMVVWLAAAGVLCGVPVRSFAEDTSKKKSKAEEEKAKDKDKDKGKSGLENLRDGINRAYDGFKEETNKGKKNLNDLYEREKAK